MLGTWQPQPQLALAASGQGRPVVTQVNLPLVAMSSSRCKSGMMPHLLLVMH